MVDSSGREIEMELVKSAEMKEMHRLVEQIRGMVCQKYYINW